MCQREVLKHRRRMACSWVWRGVAGAGDDNDKMPSRRETMHFYLFSLLESKLPLVFASPVGVQKWSCIVHIGVEEKSRPGCEIATVMLIILKMTHQSTCSMKSWIWKMMQLRLWRPGNISVSYYGGGLLVRTCMCRVDHGR
jgi:hypothetical protein